MEENKELSGVNIETKNESNSLAIAGLICSLCGLITCGFTSIIGLILSIIGLSKSKNMNGEGKGLAIGGIVSGAIILLLNILIIILFVIGIGSIKPSSIEKELKELNNNKNIIDKITKDKLVCTKTSTENEMVMDQKVEAYFKSDTVDNITISLSVDLGEKYAGLTDVFKKTFEEQYKSYSNNGQDLKIENDGSKININISIDPSKLTDDQKNEFGITNVNEGIEIARKSLEDEGYTCE